MATTSSTQPRRVSPAEITTFCREDIKRLWPKWPTKRWSIKRDSHGQNASDLIWLDHVTEAQMTELLGKYSTRSMLYGPPATFEREGQSSIPVPRGFIFGAFTPQTS